MRTAKTVVYFFCFFLAFGSGAQDIVAKLKPQYKTYVSRSLVSDKKLKSLLSALQVSEVQEVIVKGSKPSVADGIISIRIRDKSFARQVSEMLNQSGFFQYVEVLNSKTNLPLHIPSDPFAAPVTGSQYYLEKVNAYNAWDISKGDTNMTICIVDNGADFTHPEFQNKIQINKNDPVDGIDNDNDGFTDNFRGWDFANNDNFPEDSTGAKGHGSEVSGIAAANTNNGLGIASMGYNCRFVPYKIFGNNGVSSYTQYLAVAYAAQLGCKVINMSWGAPGDASDIYQYEQDLLNYAALDKDAVLVGATYPLEGGYFTFPGDYENVLSVLSLFSDDTKSIPQATHYWIDMSVPGLNMFSTTLKGYGTYTGISVGLPLVSGAAALARTKYPGMNSLQIQELLRVTARNIDTVKTNVDYKEKLGHGCLDAFEVLTDTITPAIRIKEYELKRVKNDTVSLQLGFRNYLWKSKSLKLTFRPVSGGFTVFDSVANAGVVKMLDSSVTVFADIKLIIPPFDKTNNIELVRIGIEDSANHYYDYQYFYIDKNFESIITAVSESSYLPAEARNIYPNPCTDNLIVETSNVDQVSLTDFSGRVIYKEVPFSDFTNINMTTYPSGIYFLQIRSEGNINRTKIVKK